MAVYGAQWREVEERQQVSLRLEWRDVHIVEVSKAAGQLKHLWRRTIHNGVPC